MQFDLIKFLAAVAVFVYAMLLIEQSVRNMAGRSFKKFLQRQSRNRLKIIGASTLVTAFLQGSSVVLLMVLSFVGSGVMNMRGALAAVLGCNLGSTLNNWLIALIGFRMDLGEVAYPLLALALVGLLFASGRSKLFQLALFFTGLALVFVSLEWFKSCVNRSLEDALGNFAQLHYLLFIPVGFVITALVQSSSVTVAVTLAGLFNQIIPFDSAAALVIGSELGTTLKFLLGSFGGIVDKRRVAVGNSFVNLATVILAALLLKPLVYLLQEVLGLKDPLTALVAFQTTINLATLFLFFPLLGTLANVLERLIKEKRGRMTRYISKHETEQNGTLDASEKEIARLLRKTIDLNRIALGLSERSDAGVLTRLKRFASGSSTFEAAYEDLKLLQGEIFEYISSIPDEAMNDEEIDRAAQQIGILRRALRSFKNLKDIRHNLEDFNASGNDALYSLFSKMRSGAGDLYGRAQELLEQPEKISEQLIKRLNDENRQNYDDIIAAIMAAAKQRAITEMESVNLLNVNREIYSSHKALIRALAECDIPERNGATA